MNCQSVNQIAEDEKEPLISHNNLGDSTNHVHDDFEYEAVSQDEDSDEDTRIRHEDSFSSGNAQNYNTYYEINEIIEMGKMASLFFNRWGRTLFYLCITIYLYGDLAIYAAAVAKSLRDVACTFTPANTSRSTGNISENALCWEDTELIRIDAYRYHISLKIGCQVGLWKRYNVSGVSECFPIYRHNSFLFISEYS